MSECGNSPKNGWHLWVSGSSQKIGKTPVCYWCGKRKDQEEKNMSNPKVVFEAVPSRWRVECRTRQSYEWQTEVYASTLEEAREVAQEMTNHDLDGAYRVVDTQPEAVTGRRITDDAITIDNLKASVPFLQELRKWNILLDEESDELEDAARVTDTAVDTRPEEVATGRRIAEDVITSDQIAKIAAVGANLQWSKPSDLAEMSINAHQLTVPLTLDAYQQQAKATAVYPARASFRYLIAGLAGEVGELASIFAKHWRGDGDLNPDHATAELGDVLWFVAMLAHELGCDLSDVAQGNLNKLADRANRGKLKGSGDNR